MIDAAAFARLLCGYCLDAQPGQQVVVSSTTLAAPALLAVQGELLRRGAWPLLRTALPGQDEAWWAAAQDAHLDAFAPAELAEAEGTDAAVAIRAPENTTALAGVDPARIARAARTRAPVREATFRRRWCVTLWPTPAAAQQAGMGTADLEAFVTRATFLDRDDPAAAWGELHDLQARLIERLRDARELRIEAEGTDLRLRVDGRTWVNSDGRRNMPSGEVFTGPLEDSAEGTIRFGIPSSPRGVEVAGIELTFRSGQVVDARAERGHDYLLATLDTDPGRPLPGRDRHRHEPRDRPPDRRDPVRREDRRHRPSRRRPLVPGDRRHERERGALGHDLRPAGRRAAQRGRRDDPAGRRVHRSSRYGLPRSCAGRRSSPPSVPPHGTPRSSSRWSRPGWTSRG